MKKTTTLLFLVFIFKVSVAQPFMVNFGSGGSAITCGNPSVTIFVTGSFTAPVTYSWTNSQSTATGTIVTITTPGSYTITASSGTMTTSVPISILSNTFAPNINATASGTVLSCATSSIVLQGSSGTQSVSYLWSGNQGTVVSSSATINANYTLTPSTSPFGTYTLTVTDLTNQCTSNTVITIYQNIYPPNANIVSSSNALTCLTNSVNLSNNSSTGIPPNSIFSASLSVIAFSWAPGEGPPGSTYQVNTPGTYTMIAQDLNNGCIGTATITIGDNRIYPVILGSTIYTIACPAGTVRMPTVVQGNMSNVTYSWSAPPGASIFPSNTATSTANSAGIYTVTAIDQISKCASTVLIYVYGCVGLNDPGNILSHLDIFPNPIKDKLHFSIDPALQITSKLNISNALGQILLSKDNVNLNEELDLIFLAPGVYYLKLESGKSIKTFKIIKER